MKRFGLIGYPLGHSFSRGYFTEKFRQGNETEFAYENYLLESVEALPELIRNHPDLYGLNVTIPHKQTVMPYLNEIEPIAAKIGAVNCVKIERRGEEVFLKGYNADAVGFRRSLLAMLGEERSDALVLGTGGASKAVAYVLAELGIRFRLVSRTGDGSSVFSYSDLSVEIIETTPLIINTTPLGTFPNTETLPSIPYEAVGRNHFLHDLVYNPAETAFLKQGRLRGATLKNGYDMLVGQAERSWEIWNGKE